MEKNLLDRNFEEIVLRTVGSEILEFLNKHDFSLYGCLNLENEFGNFFLDYKNDEICVKIVNDRSDMVLELGIAGEKEFYYIGDVLAFIDKNFKASKYISEKYEKSLPEWNSIVHDFKNQYHQIVRLFESKQNRQYFFEIYRARRS